MCESIKGFPMQPFRGATILTINENSIVYNTIERDGSEVLRRFWPEDDKSDIISAYPSGVCFISDKSTNDVYAVNAKDGYLSFTDVAGHTREMPITNSAEMIIGISNEGSILFIKTAEDYSDEEQIQRLYMVDLKKSSILLINNEMMLASYCMPYCMTNGSYSKILVEEAVVFPYELAELNSNTKDAPFSNRIFCVDVDKLAQAEESDYAVPFSEVNTGELVDNGYLQLLDTTYDFVYISCVSRADNCTWFRKVNIKTNAVEDEIKIAGLITSVLKRNGAITELYSWSGNDLSLFSADGLNITNINFEKFLKDNASLELNYVVACVAKQYVIFDATDYTNDDDEKQVRVVYDIKEKSFAVYPYLFIAWKGECY